MRFNQMGTLRASVTSGGERVRAEQSKLRGLLEACVPGGFLLPSDFTGCEHDFVSLESGYSVCRTCGAEHFCCCGECPEVITRLGERICSITGCITKENEMRPERDVILRTGPADGHRAADEEECDKRKRPGSSFGVSKRHKAFNIQDELGETKKGKKNKSGVARSSTSSLPSHSISELLRRGGCDNLRGLVESTVREILASDKTERCLEQERKRNEIKELSVFARGLREVSFAWRALFDANL